MQARFFFKKKSIYQKTLLKLHSPILHEAQLLDLNLEGGGVLTSL